MDETIEQEEQRIMSETDIKASISPTLSAGAIALKFVAGQFLGVFPKYFANKAINNWNNKALFQTLEADMDIEEGEVKDLVDKTLKVREMILTEKNLFFLYDKGFISKTKRMIVLPLWPITSIAVKGMLGKYVVISYNIPHEKKPIRFDLVLHPKEPEALAEAIRKHISPPV